jgi:hypothetical protein
LPTRAATGTTAPRSSTPRRPTSRIRPPTRRAAADLLSYCALSPAPCILHHSALSWQRCGFGQQIRCQCAPACTAQHSLRNLRLLAPELVVLTSLLSPSGPVAEWRPRVGRPGAGAAGRRRAGAGALTGLLDACPANVPAVCRHLMEACSARRLDCCDAIRCRRKIWTRRPSDAEEHTQNDQASPRTRT